MKGIKVTLTVAAAALLLSSPAMAFHSGGVADCDGCHTMHNSLDGAAMTGTNSEGLNTAGSTFVNAVGKAAKFLLRGSDQSSTCLNCHGDPSPGSYHISTPGAVITAGGQPVQYTPGGDFAWLKKTFTWTNSTSDTAALSEEGETHGHNIVAADFGYVADAGKAGNVAPTGFGYAGIPYPVSALGCSSCHDPHGRYRRTTDAADPGLTGTAALYTTTGAPIWASGSYGATVLGTFGTFATAKAVGSYRILGGIGYIPKSLGDTSAATPFAYNPPTAVAPSTYNVSESVAQVRVAYGKGMSEWCANCHAGMHNSAYVTGVADQVHPAGNGAVLQTSIANIAANYNAYKMSGDATGVVASSYNTLVPFETQVTTIGATGLTSYAGKKNFGTTSGNITKGADAASTVMCLSCHRAHASGFPSMLRYQIENEFTTLADSTGAVVYPGTDLADPATGAFSYSKARTNRGRVQADYQAAYNGRPATQFAAFQRALCNKCHMKD